MGINDTTIYTESCVCGDCKGKLKVTLLKDCVEFKIENEVKETRNDNGEIILTAVPFNRNENYCWVKKEFIVKLLNRLIIEEGLK